LKNNNLNPFKFFPGQCDIFKDPFALRLRAFAVKFILFPKRYTYSKTIIQNLKSTESQQNQQKNILQLILNQL